MAHNAMTQESCPCGIPCKHLLDCNKVNKPLKISFKEIGKIRIKVTDVSMYQRVLIKKFGYQVDENNPEYVELDFENILIQREIFKANPKCPAV